MSSSALCASGQIPPAQRSRGNVGPEILFPHHGAGLDYRDFTGKPTPDFVRTAVTEPSARVGSC